MYRQTERQTRGFICKTGRYIEYEIYIYTEFEKDLIYTRIYFLIAEKQINENAIRSRIL